MRKSSTLSSRYRPGTSRNRKSATTFREQMADYARGDVLRELRSQRRMSRENVAAEIGVTTKTLYAWEKQNGAIKWENAKLIATFYGVDPDSIVTRDADEAAGLPSRDQLDRIEAKLDTILAALDIAAGDPVSLPDRIAQMVRDEAARGPQSPGPPKPGGPRAGNAPTGKTAGGRAARH